MKINLFTISSLSIAVVCYLLALIIFINSRKKVHTLWAFFNIAVGTFGVGSFLVSISQTYQQAFLSWKITLFGVAFIALFFYHFVYEFCGLKNEKLLKFAYVHGILFAVLGLSTNFIFHDLKFAFNEFYYYKAGLGFDLFFIVWLSLVFLSFYKLFEYISTVRGLPRTQGRYLFWGMLLGFLSGSTTSFPSWGIMVYPAWDFFICVYAAISTYAILRFQLLDIKLVFTRLGVFVAVYSLVLGIPFWLSYKMFGWGNWLFPATVGTILASTGPFVYLYFNNRAEAKLLEVERRIQQTLTNASIGMSTIRDLQKLSNKIVYVLKQGLDVEHVSLYLSDQSSGDFIMKVSMPEVMETVILKNNNPLLLRLTEVRSPLVLEEIQHNLHSKKEDFAKLSVFSDWMKKLNAAVIIPSFRGDNLLAFVVVGKRRAKELYSKELMNVFTVVGNQIALAIENAIYYEEIGKDWTERAHESRLRTMGAMGTGIAHQMKNRFNAIKAQLLLLRDIVGDFRSKTNPEEIDQLYKESDETIELISKNIDQGVDVVNAIKNFSKNTSAAPQVVDCHLAFGEAIKLLELSRKKIEFKFEDKLPPNLILWTNLSMLTDLFYNLIDNSNDAITTRKEMISAGTADKPGNDYTVMVSANPNGKMCEILIEDNGSGIKPEDLEEGVGVNVMYFTTKGATKGTGMGLALMRQFIKHNGGVLKITSEYKKWTKISFSLPLATEEQIKEENDKTGGIK